MRWLITLFMFSQVAFAAEMPEWLKTKVSELSRENSHIKVQLVQYQDREMYYIPKRCCDKPGELYEANGERFCTLEGGWGPAQSKCKDFHKNSKVVALVWEHKPYAAKRKPLPPTEPP